MLVQVGVEIYMETKPVARSFLRQPLVGRQVSGDGRKRRAQVAIVSPSAATYRAPGAARRAASRRSVVLLIGRELCARFAQRYRDEPPTTTHRRRANLASCSRRGENKRHNANAVRRRERKRHVLRDRLLGDIGSHDATTAPRRAAELEVKSTVSCSERVGVHEPLRALPLKRP